MSSTENAFLEALSPVFTDLAASAQESLYVDGTSRLLAGREGDVTELNALMDMLERRVTMLDVLSRPWWSVTCSCGSAPRTTSPALRSWRWWPPAMGCRSGTLAPSR